MAHRVILLQAEDTTGKEGLWESDGTTAGTFEIHPAVPVSPSGFLLNAPSFATLKGRVYFDGLDYVNSSSHPNLWVTDGTSAGTVELTVSGAFSGGLAPSNMTTFGNKIVFEGTDSNQKRNLWVTDGTAAGTVELNVAGENVTYGGLFTASAIEPYFTVYKGMVLFEGVDSSGNYGLWTTDGTSGGTKELVIAGAAPGGIFAMEDPHFGILANGLVIFTGTDADTNAPALFVTDGTGPGTHEIAVPVGTPYSSPQSSGLAMAVLNGLAYFAGSDGSVWVSDGTAGGTHSIGPIAGAYGNGTDIQPSDFEVVGNRVLFAGSAAGSNNSSPVVLWSTDGTAGGTFEISAPNSATNFVPKSIDTLNGIAEFAGLDSSGKWGLWVTDGIHAAQELSPAGANTQSTGLFPNYMTTVVLGAAVAGDFNGDGKSDQIFQNGNTFTEWQSTGNSFTTNVYVNSLGTGWSLAGIGDFNSDGDSDLIFQNGGIYTEWQSTGNSFTVNVSVFSVGAGWNLAGVGDFNGDGESDLIFQNGGTYTEWQSTGNSFSENVYVNTVGAGWNLAGVGDFNGDGKSDLIFQNGGTFTEWQSTGNSFTQNVSVFSVGAGWTLAGVGDFNGDGKSDLIFQNGGTFTEWQSTGNGFTPNVVVDTLGAGWSVAAIGDFNGDGKSDILFRNTNGTFSEWQSTGTGFTQNVFVDGAIGNAWTLEYSPTSASRTPGAPAGLAASTTTPSLASSSIDEGGLITTDTTIGMLNQQSSLVANPSLLFGGPPS